MSGEQPAEPVAWLEFTDHDIIKAISPATRLKWIEADPINQAAAKAYPVAAYAHPDPRIAKLEGLLQYSANRLRQAKAAIKGREHTGFIDEALERIEAALGGK